MSTNRYPGLTDAHAAAIVAREPFRGGQQIGYRTKGGTYILASPGYDKEPPRDIFAILADDTVVPLRFNAYAAPVERILADAREEQSA